MTRPSDINVVILCAGLGKRLRPLTDTLPKALVTIAGKPLLEYHLEAIRDVGLRDVICVTGYLGEKIQEFAGDGSRFGLKISYVRQELVNGTGAAVLAAATDIKSDPYAVVYADVWINHLRETWEKLIGSHTPKMVCAQVPDASDFGRVTSSITPKGLVLKTMVEKDGMATPGLVYAGMLLLPKMSLQLLRGQGLSVRGEIELPPVVMALVRNGKKVELVVTPQWTDIGTIAALQLVESQIEAAETRSPV